MRSRRPPFSCCGWRCVWCCRLSRCIRSLASAGNVCWAKPNHGFFNCQQPVANYFRRALAVRSKHVHAMPRRRTPEARTHACKTTFVIPACKQWRGLQRFFRCSDAHQREILRTRCACARRPRAAIDAADANANGAMRLRVAQARLRESARTFFALCGCRKRCSRISARRKTKNPRRCRRGFR